MEMVIEIIIVVVLTFGLGEKRAKTFVQGNPPPFGPCLKENTFWVMGCSPRGGHIFICDAVSGRVPGTD